MKLLFLGSFLLIGCASPFILMVNPKSGQSVECSASGIGVIPAIAANNRVDSCVGQYEGMGYVKADQLTQEQRNKIEMVPPNRQHKLDIERTPAVHCSSSRMGHTVYTDCN